jgi:hypothetical protein
MVERENYRDLRKAWFGLASDAYFFYLKSMLVGQEQAAELTRALLARADKYQEASLNLAEAYSNLNARTQQFWLSLGWRNANRGAELVNRYLETSNGKQPEEAGQPKVQVARR